MNGFSLDRRIVGVALLLALACALPFVLANYRVFQMTLVLAYAIALLGLNMLTGYNGQISLGHGAFYAIGAYAAAILMDKYSVPYWATIPVAGAICFGAGFLFGLPALRLEGLYLALATFALGVAMPQILKHEALAKWTGGSMGVVITKPDAPEWSGLSQDQWLYFFTLFWVVVLFIFGWNLLRGRIGRAMVAIRDQPIAAQAMGVNTSLVKSLTFGVSALYTGIAGALGAIAVQFVAPDSFTFFLSITLLVGVVIGGLASISGAFFGAVFIQFIPNIADQISKAAPWAIYGVVLIACMYAMPSGVVGLLRLAEARWSRRPRRRVDPIPPVTQRSET
jgi:branched-chain amino acid transport system permease protein